MSPSASAVSRAAASSRSTARRAAVRPPWPCTRSPTLRSSAASPRSSTPSTRSTPSTPKIWGSTPTPCSCPRRTPVSRSGAIDSVVIASVAALVPRAEIEGEMGDSHVGLQARLMSQALRKITGALSNSGTTAIFINQLREKIGVMFGSPETTTGGKALKFYASVRLDVRRIETLKDGTDAVGNRTRVKVVKNKVSPPFKQAEFDIVYGEGISREGSLIDVGVEQGFIRKSGSWFTYEGEQLGQGKENARNFLLENADVANEIEKKIKEKLGIGAVVTDGLTDDSVLPAPVDF